MDDATLLAELAAAAGALLDRHLDAAHEWFPHDYQPAPGRGEGGRPTLPEGVVSALVVNTVTEDALPFYFAGLLRQLGDAEPWWDWARRWTAEEMRHGLVLHQYVTTTGCVDLVALERARMQHLATGRLPGQPTAAEAFVYLALQEHATRIAHSNTGKRLPDEVGRRMLARVAADENLHHRFYRDLVAAALELDPDGTVVAVDAQVSRFAMPGATMPGFARHAQAVAAAGIYSAQIMLDDVLRPAVVDSWGLDRLSSLAPEAERARDHALTFLDRFARVASALTPTSGAQGVAGGPAGSS